MIVTRGRHTVAETIERLEAAIAARGLTLFARFDHGAAARAAGLELADEVVLVFGDPRGGTPLMQENPAIGVELPLRIAVWDDGGVTRVGFADPRDLGERYGITQHADVLEQMRLLLDGLAADGEGDGTEVDA